MEADKIPCSVLILTRNSAPSLDQCLKNLSRFGEILIHDANSEDNTVEIAKRYGARVLPQYNTAEKSVRVKDFTEMRLRQRADAAFDWVLYVDSDEFLSDGLVDEVGEILKTAHSKVIIKFPRLPVIDGKIKRHGILYPEVMPRIHNRLGGCTLQPGKLVHEKYVYDATFTEIITSNPLYFPLPAIADLVSKDNRYIFLEVQKIQTEGYSWGRYFRWILFREPAIMLSLSLKILFNSYRYLFVQDEVPFIHEWRYVRYHFRLFRAITGAILARSMTAGKKIL
ncbi:MAG: glycosyltransferase family 2 protein [Candidatus Peribacteraceae bacterium]|nr:glycosyltransferase family 2 protein [Candidatus Peribacteraceae bacterium]